MIEWSYLYHRPHYIILWMLVITLAMRTVQSSHVIVFQVNDPARVLKIQSYIQQEKTAEILHITKQGLISVHVDSGYKQSLIENVTPHLMSDDKISVERVPDIQIKSGWKRRRRALTDFNLESYNTYDSIVEYLERLASTYRDLCDMEEIGSTFEGRSIYAFKVHGRISAARRISKVKVFIDGTQHAREWISPAVIVYIIYKLITDYNNKDNWTLALLDKYEFHFVPILNPDGYEFTYHQTGKRFWRKNKNNITSEADCIGVDLNRNWGFHWSGRGGSQHKCSNVYYGENEFSEMETRAVSEYILKYKGTWHSYFSLHSFGQMILFPWSHSAAPGPDYHKHRSASQQMAKGIKEINNITYATGSVGSLLYVASGSSESWAYAVAGIPYAYTIELPDLYNFVVPPEKIRPTAHEFMNGLKFYFRHIESTEPNLYNELLRNASRKSVGSADLLPPVIFTLTPANNGTITMVNTPSVTRRRNSSTIVGEYTTTSFISKLRLTVNNKNINTTTQATVLRQTSKNLENHFDGVNKAISPSSNNHNNTFKHLTTTTKSYTKFATSNPTNGAEISVTFTSILGYCLLLFVLICHSSHY